jgi:pimeloyl-ACP methyl ester carboxylesterase
MIVFMLVAAALFAMQISSKEITFQGAGGFELKGTLLMPVGAKAAPAFVLLSGSGPTDRDDNALAMGVRTDVLKQVAERLAENGVATLRFDKRAVHSYSDKWPKDMSQIGPFFSWENFVGDAAAAHDFLMHQPGIDPAKVGICGHSEGSLIALKIASIPANKVNGLMLLAGQGRPLDAVVMQQLREKLPGQLAKAGIGDQLSTYLDYARNAFVQLKKDGTVPPNGPAGLAGLFNASALTFLHGNLQDDPAKLATMYTGDVLVMNGALDNQVSPELDAKVLEQSFKQRKLGFVQLVIVPGASHAFKATPNRDTDQMDGPMVPSALDAITGWCKKHMISL